MEREKVEIMNEFKSACKAAAFVRTSVQSNVFVYFKNRLAVELHNPLPKHPPGFG